MSPGGASAHLPVSVFSFASFSVLRRVPLSVCAICFIAVCLWRACPGVLSPPSCPLVSLVPLLRFVRRNLPLYFSFGAWWLSVYPSSLLGSFPSQVLFFLTRSVLLAVFFFWALVV